MKKIIILAFLSLGTFVSINVIASTPTTNSKLQNEDAVSHSGRTNKQGCHNDRIHGGYHCH